MTTGTKVSLTRRKKLIKKIILLLLFSFLTIGNCFAKNKGSRFKITESEQEFDVIYYLTEDMKVIENKQNEDVNVTQTFSINKEKTNAEVRYSLFTDIGEDDNDLQIQFSMLVFMCINNIAGFEISENAISAFKNEDVKNEFNGDFGCTAFLQNPASDYAKDYKYMMVEFFCKEKQGVVMRVFLFNDLSFIGINENGQLSSDSIWLSNYHTFEFMEKDKNGSFIPPKK